MTSWIAIQVIALFVLLIVSAFFSSAEVAVFSLNPIDLRRLQSSHPQAASRLHNLLSPPTRFLSTILIGNTFVNVVISVLGFALAVQWLGRHGEWAAVLAMTLLLLVFGEVIPKRVAFLWPERMALLYAWPLTLIMNGLAPLRVGLEMITNRFASLFHARGRTLSEEEFETVLELSGESGVLHHGEREMLKSVLRLEDLEARDVMTPRVDLIGYNLNGENEPLGEVGKRAKVRQLVLYREHLDQVEGLLDVRSYLLDPTHRLRPAIAPPLYVPESAPLDRLLARFLHEKKRAAIVVDEYGGTAGIVTRGDIIEEIVGEIDDEHADHKRLFESAGPRRWVLDGQISLEEINAKLDLSLSAENAERLAGWLAEKLERLPRPGDRVDAEGCRVVVQQMRKHRVHLVSLELVEESPA